MGLLNKLLRRPTKKLTPAGATSQELLQLFALQGLLLTSTMEAILANYCRYEGKYLPPFKVLEDAVHDRLMDIRKGMGYLLEGADSTWDVHLNKKKPACYNIGYVCSWKNVSWKDKTYTVLASHVENYRRPMCADEGEFSVYFLLEGDEGRLFYGQTKTHDYTRNQFIQVAGLEMDGVWTLEDFYSVAQGGFEIRRCVIRDFLQGLCRLSAYGVKGEEYGADSFFAKVVARDPERALEFRFGGRFPLQTSEANHLRSGPVC